MEDAWHSHLQLKTKKTWHSRRFPTYSSMRTRKLFFFFLNAEDFRCIFKENIIENIDDCHNITISFFIMRIRDYLAGFILYFVYK